ncbi:MAG: hypothetical protein WBN42_13775 [Ignavibacteriaceae bacterium]
MDKRQLRETELSMNAEDREYVLATIELMCLADSRDRLDEILQAVAFDLDKKNVDISTRALAMLRSAGTTTRNFVEHLVEVDVNIEHRG